MSQKVKYAVIPVAGLGTRFLPITKNIPKEMLPIGGKPTIQHIVEEAVRAGIENTLMITGRNKRALEDHFDRNYELECELEASNKNLFLESVQYSNNITRLFYTRQGNPDGLGHAVLCSKNHVGNNPFVVMLGDDLIDENQLLLEEMIKIFENTGKSVVALIEVPKEQIHLYGCADVALNRDFDKDSMFSLVNINELVEKPTIDDAPSNYAIIGRYVLSPKIFEILEKTPADKDGKIQLTDALAELGKLPEELGGGLVGVVFRGRRFDTGDKLSYIKSVVTLEVENNEFGKDFANWLVEFSKSL